MRMGKPYDLVFTTKIVAVLTFLFTGRKKSVFLYTFAKKVALENKRNMNNPFKFSTIVDGEYFTDRVAE